MDGSSSAHGLDSARVHKILQAVEERFDRQVAFLTKIVQSPSLRGKEAGVQNIVADALSERGYEVHRFGIDEALISVDPAFSPMNIQLKDTGIVVGTREPKREGGRSLALNAHVDVVPTGPEKRWKYPPYSATREGDWLYGRGAGDMKAGLCANLFALDALEAAGLRLKGKVQIQSVIEEEVTGNGAAMVLAAGFKADAVLISEPTDEKLVAANTGVMKFAITVQGVPAHPFEVARGRSAIDVAHRAIEELRVLESQWRSQHLSAGELFDGVDNPIALTIGTISGGEWLASVPSECRFEGRIGFYPHEDVSVRAKEFEEFVDNAFQTDEFLAGCPRPEIEWVGVKQGGFVLEPGSQAESCLAMAHRAVDGEGRSLERFVMPCYLDASVFARHGGMTSLVYGPVAEAIHAVDERVSLASLKHVTKAIALFAAAWCGVEDA
ncbi:ArgE/DapE family deacylase (plasmid) [Rhizobium jaguaris]|uniref:Probable succinyl-diaminopimelate desuccinylase n=2 Tax=Rhizobium jaguaris TaxID=1312183 RepID=A0A387G7R4_9HYPH|nr:ArgE/DapE family deacylase [Rhizobium jaguaris]